MCVCVCGGVFQKVGPEKPIKSKRSVPTSIGLNMQIMQSCFAIDCLYICISEFRKSVSVVPQLSSPPPKFYEDGAPDCGCAIQSTCSCVLIYLKCLSLLPICTCILIMIYKTFPSTTCALKIIHHFLDVYA